MAPLSLAFKPDQSAAFQEPSAGDLPPSHRNHIPVETPSRSRGDWETETSSHALHLSLRKRSNSCLLFSLGGRHTIGLGRKYARRFPATASRCNGRGEESRPKSPRGHNHGKQNGRGSSPLVRGKAARNDSDHQLKCLTD